MKDKKKEEDPSMEKYFHRLESSVCCCNTIWIFKLCGYSLRLDVKESVKINSFFFLDDIC